MKKTKRKAVGIPTRNKDKFRVSLGKILMLWGKRAGDSSFSDAVISHSLATLRTMENRPVPCSLLVFTRYN